MLTITKTSKSGFSCLITSMRSLSAPISKLSEVVNGPVAAIIVKPTQTKLIYSVRGRHNSRTAVILPDMDCTVLTGKGGIIPCKN